MEPQVNFILIPIYFFTFSGAAEPLNEVEIAFENEEIRVEVERVFGGVGARLNFIPGDSVRNIFFYHRLLLNVRGRYK